MEDNKDFAMSFRDPFTMATSSRDQEGDHVTHPRSPDRSPGRLESSSQTDKTEEGRNGSNTRKQQEKSRSVEGPSADALLQSMSSAADQGAESKPIPHIEPKQLQFLLENYNGRKSGTDKADRSKVGQHETTAKRQDGPSGPKLTWCSPLLVSSELTAPEYSPVSEPGEIKPDHRHGIESSSHATHELPEEKLVHDPLPVEEESNVKITDWRIRGRFLEYHVTLFGDAVSYWEKGMDVERAGHLHHIRHFFRTHRPEHRILKRLVQHTEGPDAMVTSNVKPRINGSHVLDLVEIKFLVSHLGSEIGKPYDSVLAVDLDYAVWREAIAQHWREQKVRYNLWQIKDTQDDRSIGGRTVIDISKHVLFYEESDEMR